MTNYIPCFSILPTDILKYTKNKSAIVLLVCLCDKINPSKGLIAWPSYDAIKEETGMGRTSISNAIKELERVGLIEKEVGTRTKSNRYIPVYRERIEQSQNRTPVVQKQDSSSPKIGLQQSQNRTPVVPERDCNNNHINNNHIDNNQSKGVKRFSPPSLMELEMFCKEEGFCDFDFEMYHLQKEANGWTLGGGRKMKCWRSDVRVWNRKGWGKKSQGQGVNDFVPKPDKFFLDLIESHGKEGE